MRISDKLLTMWVKLVLLVVNSVKLYLTAFGFKETSQTIYQILLEIAPFILVRQDKGMTFTYRTLS